MSISYIEVMPICGTAVSLDICDSTNKFEKISESSGGSFNLYRVVDKVQKVILYVRIGDWDGLYQNESCPAVDREPVIYTGICYCCNIYEQYQLAEERIVPV